MIGRVIEEEGQKIVQTLAGATAGTVCKVNYGVDCNYAIPITPNELGEGYVGVSCVCPGPFYNPFTGTLTACSVEAKSTEAEASEMVMSNSLTGDTVYNLAMWCATADGCYNNIGFSGGRSITYNPYTATLNACCANINDLLTATSACITNLEATNANLESLTVTNKIDGSILKADGTNCYDQYCIESITSSSDRPILITGADGAYQTNVVASIGRSTNCQFTYNPGTGVLKRCGAEMGGYTLTLAGAEGGTIYALIDVGNCNGNVIEGKIYSNTFSLVKYCAADAIYRHSEDNYGNVAVGHINDTTTCVWIKYSGWINPELFGQKPIKLVCSTTTAPDGITFKNSSSYASNAICATSATTAVCAECHCRCGYNTAYDFDIALENGTTNVDNVVTYVSSSCRLRYCNTTGNLRITNSAGTIAGTVQATNLCGELYGGLGNTTYDTSQFWGNQIGTSFYAFSDNAGGAIAFRCNNPTSGQMSIVIDGTVYTCEGQYRVLNTADLKGCGVCKFSISGNTLIISAR